MLNDYTPIIPRLEPAAARIIRGTTQTFGTCFEYGFRCQWDAVEQRAYAPVLTTRGNRGLVGASTMRFPAGSLFLHTHPEHVASTPSDDDLKIAETMAWQGIGFAVTTYDAAGLFLVSAPDAAVASQRRVTVGSRLWSLGRLQLAWVPGPGVRR